MKQLSDDDMLKIITHVRVLMIVVALAAAGVGTIYARITHSVPSEENAATPPVSPPLTAAPKTLRP